MFVYKRQKKITKKKLLSVRRLIANPWMSLDISYRCCLYLAANKKIKWWNRLVKISSLPQAMEVCKAIHWYDNRNSTCTRIQTRAKERRVFCDNTSEYRTFEDRKKNFTRWDIGLYCYKKKTVYCRRANTLRSLNTLLNVSTVVLTSWSTKTHVHAVHHLKYLIRIKSTYFKW